MQIIENMFSDNITALLQQLGDRLRAERLARDESQTRFAARVGVSVPTLRRMEQGDASAQIGHWFTALTLLGRIADAETLLAPRYSLFDVAAQNDKPVRQRARRGVNKT
jgi:transcriptional regulator with XRE-family HTH domain